MEAKHNLKQFNLLNLLFILVFFLAGQMNAQAQCSATANFASTFTNCSETQFVDLSSTTPTYTIVSWDWDFGDGNTANPPESSTYLYTRVYWYCYTDGYC